MGGGASAPTDGVLYTSAGSASLLGAQALIPNGATSAVGHG
jgi:hypothetical protein